MRNEAAPLVALGVIVRMRRAERGRPGQRQQVVIERGGLRRFVQRPRGRKCHGHRSGRAVKTEAIEHARPTHATPSPRCGESTPSTLCSLVEVVVYCRWIGLFGNT